MQNGITYSSPSLDPRVKLIASMSFLMLISTIYDAFILFLSFIAVLCAWLLAKLPVKTVSYFFKSIALLFAFMFFSSTVFSRIAPKERLTYIQVIPAVIPIIGGSGIYAEILLASITFSFRSLSLVSMALLVSLTTEPSRMVSALRKLRCPYELTIMVVITIRFIPLAIAQWKKLTAVANVRGIETNGIIGRIKSIKRLFTPLIIHSIRRSMQLAYSLDARGFRATKNPTTLDVLRLKSKDYLMLIFSFCLVALSIVVVLGVFPIPDVSVALQNLLV
ncbi:MAG: energy-coupling factor transporter transmembrane component T family protein [Promethearchaeota archaeon]